MVKKCKPLRKATMNDYMSVLEHYYKILTQTPDMDKYARWKKGLHPKENDIKAYIEADTMYLLMDDNVIAGSMAVTLQQGTDYHDISWEISATDDEVAVVHLLGINPDYQKKGIGGEMIDLAIDIARENGKKVIRLDALDSNLPAKHLYTHKKFEYRGKQNIYADNTGWTDFCFYELTLE